MSNSITKYYLLICALLLVVVTSQAQIVCYVNDSSDSNYVYGYGAASIPYGSTAHLTNLKLKITSPYGRVSQSYYSGYSINLSMPFSDANGEYEDGSYSFLVETEGTCYYNNWTHAMANAYSTLYEPPKIIIDSFACTPTTVHYYNNSNEDGSFNTSITSSKSLKGATVKFYVGLVMTTCGTTTGGGQGSCPPTYTVSPDIGVDVDVTLQGVTPVNKTWQLRNSGSNNGNGGTVKLRIVTEAINFPTVVVVNNLRESTATLAP